LEPTPLNNQLKRKGLIVFIIIILVILTISVVGNKNNKTNLFTNPYLYIITPFKDGYNQATNYFSFVLNKYIFITEMFDENIRLKDEIVTLSMQNNKLIEEKKEFLRRLSNLKDLDTYQKETGIGYSFLEAIVINKNFTGFTSSIVINKGYNDGIRKNMPVLSGGGIVGKTYDVSKNYTKVILVNDLRSSVDVILEKSRHNGVVSGAGKANSLNLNYIQKDFDIFVDENVISSGYGGVFPKGLIVGKINTISDDIFGLFKEITVTPYVNFRKIENVTVLLVDRDEGKNND